MASRSDVGENLHGIPYGGLRFPGDLTTIGGAQDAAAQVTADTAAKPNPGGTGTTNAQGFVSPNLPNVQYGNFMEEAKAKFAADAEAKNRLRSFGSTPGYGNAFGKGYQGYNPGAGTAQMVAGMGGGARGGGVPVRGYGASQIGGMPQNGGNDLEIIKRALLGEEQV